MPTVIFVQVRPAVGGPEEERPEIVEQVAGRRQVRDGRVVRGRLDAGDEGPRPDPAGRHLTPGPAAVGRGLHPAVVGAPPRGRRPSRVTRRTPRWCRRAPARRRAVAPDERAGRLHPGPVDSGEVRADRGPARALVGRAEHALTGHVEDVRVVRRERDRRRPGEAVTHRARAARPGLRLGPDLDVPRLPGPLVEARELTGELTGEDDVRLVRSHGDEAGLPAADVARLGVGDRREHRTARQRDRAAVLLGAVHAVRDAAVGGHVVGARRSAGCTRTTRSRLRCVTAAPMSQPTIISRGARSIQRS